MGVKINAMERALRGLERCGFHVYAVGTAECAKGVTTLFPHGDEGQDATPRTVAKWQREWHRLQELEAPRAVFDYLIKTGRTEEATLSWMQVRTQGAPPR